MRRSRLAAARAGHVRKRGQPCGRQRNVGSPRGPHLMVSTSMVYGCTIDVFNTEDISAECPRRSALRSCYDYVLGLCGRMKDVVGRVFRPLRCFAALPRNHALLWERAGDLVVTAFYPFAFSRLWRETRSAMERAGDAAACVSSPLIATLGPVAGHCWCCLVVSILSRRSLCVGGSRGRGR